MKYWKLSNQIKTAVLSQMKFNKFTKSNEVYSYRILSNLSHSVRLA